MSDKTISIGNEVQGSTLTADATVCYVWTLNNIGGIETLLARHGAWHKAKGKGARLVTCEGPMDESYQKVFDRVVSVRRYELDLPCLDDAEFDEVVMSIARRLSDRKAYHFVFFNHLGAYIAARLSALFEGSTTTLYLLEDRILAPTRLEFVEQMNLRGMVISMNEACVAGHRELYGYSLEPAPAIVPLGVDMPEVCSATPRDGNAVLTVARLYPMKEYVFGLIDAIALLAQERAGRRVTLTIIGDGPLLGELRKLAHVRGIGDRVFFAGSVPPVELQSYYAKAGVFVGMGTTLLEASGQGLPSVVAIGHSKAFEAHGFFGDTPGYSLGEASSGLAARPGVDLVRRLLDSDELRAQVAESCRLKASNHFSTDSSMALFMQKLRSARAAFIDVPMPARPADYGKMRRALKRMLRRHSMAMRLGRLCRRILGGVDF
jgi:glycosyltransferase involved in cell wall biosynthesis